MRSEPNLPARQGHKRVETAGVYPLAPAAGRGNSPSLRFSEKRPPVRGVLLTQFAYPGQPVLSKTKRGSLS